MEKNNEIFSKNTYRFLGIGGIGVSALAVYLRRMGKEVCGYDARLSTDLIARLRAYGIFVTDKVQELPSAEVTVYSGAFDKKEVISMLGNQSLLLSRAEFLGEILRRYPTSVAIAGSHGKTTATAMLGEVLRGSASTVFLGGEYPPFSQRGGFGNLYYEGEALCITEACEYRQSFLSLQPTVSVALNVEEDHMDCYANFNCLKDAFRRFLDGGTVSVVNADDPFLCEYPATVTYGLCKRADYYADRLRSEKGKYAFDCYERGKFRGEVRLSVIGKHNVYNALAVIAAARQLFVPFSVILKKVSAFSGVERRSMYLGEFSGKKIYADYAHHPTEIQATYAAYQESTAGDIAVVFQPHTYTRTVYLFSEFCRVLKGIPNLALCSTYAARAGDGLEGERALVDNLSVPLLHGEKEIKQYLNSLPENVSTVLFLGAGDIYETALSIVNSVTK